MFDGATQVVPIFRIFDELRAREFYVDYLGMKVDWEHRFEPGMPLYMQVSRGDLTIHLSEHHGDGSPGATVFVKMKGVDALHAELSARGYKYLRPGVEDAFYGARCMTLTDPFGNSLRLNEYNEEARPS